jgi:hypothetical protein
MQNSKNRSKCLLLCSSTVIFQTYRKIESNKKFSMRWFQAFDLVFSTFIITVYESVINSKPENFECTFHLTDQESVRFVGSYDQR